MKHLVTVAASAVLAGAYILTPTPAGQDGPVLDTASFETTPARVPAPPRPAVPKTPAVAVEPVERFAAEKPDPEGIPDTALLAYQRAAQILGEVSPRCELPWTLLAAIGGVESDHGRHPGSSNETGALPQSAVRVSTARGDSPIAADGPMQISPSLWSVVGVDADGDGKRSVRDLDDAALGAGVFLCAGWQGLEDPETMAEAVNAYRDSDAFVDLVLGFERAYRSVELLSPDQVMPSAPPEVGDSQLAQAQLNVGAATPAGAEKRTVKASEKAVASAEKSGKKLSSATRERTGDRAPLNAVEDRKRTEQPESSQATRPSGKPSKATEPSGKSEQAEPSKQQPKPSKPTEASKPSGPSEPKVPATPAEPAGPSGPTAPGTPAGPATGDPTSPTDGSGAPENPSPAEDKPVTEPTPGCQQPKPTPGQTPGSSSGPTPESDPSTSTEAGSATTASGTPTAESGAPPDDCTTS